MKIYEIDEAIRDVFNKFVDKETGEISVFASEMLTKLEGEKKDKCLNLAKYIKELELETEAFKISENNISLRRKAVENKAKRLKSYLSSVVNGESNETYSDNEIKISWRKSQFLDAKDIKLIPKKYRIIEQKVDNTLITRLLKQGKKIKGASLVDRNNIQIK